MDDIERGRNVAILSYLWIPGWLLALIMHGRNKSDFGAFHLRQALGIWFITLIFLFIFRWMRWPMMAIIAAAAIYGIVQAINGEKKLLPGLGQIFQDLFSGI